MIKTKENSLVVFEGIDMVGKTTFCEKSVRMYGLIADYRNRNNDPGTNNLTEDDIRDIRHALYENTNRSLVNRRLLTDRLVGKRKTSAILLDELLKSRVIDYPEHIRHVDIIDDPHVRFHTHLMRLAFKSKVMRALLPHLNIVCDRNYASVYARAVAMGILHPMPPYEDLDIFQPDLTFVMTLDEDERYARINKRARDTISPIDKMPKIPGNYLYVMENEIKRLTPEHIIDCTQRSVDEIFAHDIAPRIENLINEKAQKQAMASR